MYVRQPSQNPPRVKIPDNYGGSAFSSNTYSDMPPPVRQNVAKGPSPSRDSDYPRAELPAKSSPYVSELRGARSDGPIEDIYIDRDQYDLPMPDTNISDTLDAPAQDKKESHDNASIFSALIPKGFSSNNFPFGHGIGSEELLILGIMLLIYLSGADKGEVDGEFIALLGLLLFAG